MAFLEVCAGFFEIAPSPDMKFPALRCGSIRLIRLLVNFWSSALSARDADFLDRLNRSEPKHATHQNRFLFLVDLPLPFSVADLLRW